MAENKTKKGDDWIQDATKKPGGFTAKAKRRGITSAQLQNNVLSDPEKYDKTTVKQANLRKTLASISHKKKSKKA
tara:strand:+ start:396 stop:620 length:225 start_codon:yes stop_codon:yes gene_type:complete